MRLVRPVPVDPSGVRGPTRGQANGPNWRRTSYGYFVPSEVDSTIPEQRIMEQSVRLPEGGAVTGWGACRLWGANFLDGLAADRRTLIPVPLVVGPTGNIRRGAAISISRERFEPHEMAVLYGIPCSRRLRALFDEMRRVRDWREAVVTMDMMAAADQVSVRQMLGYAADRPSWNGIGQVRRALGFADENSRSPNETRMRLIWQVDAGFPRPLVNQHVWDLNGKLLGIADLLDPAAGVVGEFDGAHHRGARRHSADLNRESGFRDHDLGFFRVMGLDLQDTDLVVRRMQSAMSRAKWLPEGKRAWTIEPPSGWAPEPTLDEILERRDWLTAACEDESLPAVQN